MEPMMGSPISMDQLNEFELVARWRKLAQQLALQNSSETVTLRRQELPITLRLAPLMVMVSNIPKDCFVPRKAVGLCDEKQN